MRNGRQRITRTRVPAALLVLLALLAAGTTAGLARSAGDDTFVRRVERAAAASAREPDGHDADAAESGDAAAGSEAGEGGRLAAHLAQLAEARAARDPGENPASAAEAKLAAMVYPADDIALSTLEGMRGAGDRLRAAATADPAPAAWVNVGPRQALYPLTPLRDSTGYVPARYVAGGRTTALAIAPTCKPGDCLLLAGAAGGGIWRTRDALATPPAWEYVSGSFAINAIGSITLDPNDPTGRTVWVGTGEANACASGCVAGVGLYRSTDGGTTWSGPIGGSVFNARGVGSIAVKPGDPNTIYAASVTAVRSASSVCCDGVTRLVPGAAQWGLYKSTDGGTTWRFIHDGSASTAACRGDQTEAANGTPCSPRGVRRVVIDPVDPETVYASSLCRGVWRSNNGGAAWTQINPALSCTAPLTAVRAEIAVNRLPSGATRLYIAEGGYGEPTSPYSRLLRSDNARTGTPVFADLTSPDVAKPGFATYEYCGGQCWYDNFVVTPPGRPDIVYVGGSYAYGEAGGISNGRAVLLSTDGGLTFTDMTMDGTDPIHPNGLHPDQHALVVNPSNPLQFIEAGDGGMMRSSGTFSDRSSWCTDRGLAGAELKRCRQLLSRVPSRLTGVNDGLTTLQFNSLSVSPFDVGTLQGGSQDNGTWQPSGKLGGTWVNTMIGDGGQSGFDVGNPNVRMHTFFDASPEVNYSAGAMADWNWVGDQLFGLPDNPFYAAIITDPKVSGTMYAGTGVGVWRTKTNGRGTMTLGQLRQHCNEWTGDFTVTCGDWVRIGTALDSTVVAVERAPSDASTLWVATKTGGVYVSHNANAEPASAVQFTRLDTRSGGAAPNRFVSGIAIDTTNPNHAWISYQGFNASTPATPGHLFEVTTRPGSSPIDATGAFGPSGVTWTDRSYDYGDLPMTDVAHDPGTGDLYVSSDFGVFRLRAGTARWTPAGTALPHVEVASLTIVPDKHILYAASHGLGAWQLELPT